jgi:hypothetical protein
VVSLRSPVSGVVLRIPERSERIVAAGEPLLELGNCGDLEIVADLLSSDAVKVRPGDLMLVEDWGGDSALTARVRRVEPGGFTKISALGVEEQRVHVVANLGQCPAALGDGYRVEARIVIWEADSVLKVPTTPVRAARDGACFVIDGGRAAQRGRWASRTPSRRRSAGRRRDGLSGIRGPISVGAGDNPRRGSGVSLRRRPAPHGASPSHAHAFFYSSTHPGRLTSTIPNTINPICPSDTDRRRARCSSGTRSAAAM